jgi:hypothetical protein
MSPPVMRATLSILLAATATACVGGAEPSSGISADVLTPGGGDAADHACNVVLREVHIASNRGAVEQDCPSGGAPCFVVVRGTVDVANAEVEASAYPMLLWRAGDGPWNVTRVPTVAGGTLGYEQHQFAIDAFDASQPWPTVQLIPFLTDGSGARLFDHNHIANPLDSYALDPDAQLAQVEDASVCAGAAPHGLATVRFSTGWTDALTGALVPEGKLTVDYDLAREPQCEASTYNGLPAWNTEAFVRFDPSGALFQKSVVGAQDAQGWHPELFTVDVPAGATRAELWFHSSGAHCLESWDSNYGANWTFDVTR